MEPSTQRTENTILVVDDEESMVEMLSTALRSAGYQVKSEANG